MNILSKERDNADKKIGNPVVAHIIDGHSAFDDRIFYKELCSLSKKYNCYELTATEDGATLTTMGGKKREQGVYHGVRCLAFKEGSKSLIIKCIKRFLPAIYNPLHVKKVCGRICRALEEKKIYPNIIHFHDLYFAPVAIKLKNDLSCKLIFDSHEFYFPYPFNKGLSPMTCHKAQKILLQWKKAIKGADFAIGCTETMDNLISLIRQDDNHGIVYNSSIFNPETRKRSLESGKKIVLLHEGSLPFNRGLRLMLEMFRDEYIRSHFQLRVVGTVSGAEKKYFEKKCCEYNITEENIYFTGWVDYPNIPEMLKGDIGILFFEKVFNAFYSMPNKLYNYHVAGIPVLATHCADLSVTIEKLRTGIVVERTVSAVREGLVKLIDHYEEYQQRVLDYQRMFHWSVDEDRLFGIYEKMLKN